MPVSVVVTAYQQAALAVLAARSALAQSHPRTEVVVVDDGSDDGTAELLEGVPGIGLVRQANAGVSAARNTGVARSTGEVLCFLDGDDLLHPDAVERGLALMAASGADFTLGRSRLVDADGRPLPTRIAPRVTGDLYEALLREAWVAPPGVVLVRRTALAAVGPWDASIHGGSEDLDLYLRLARQCSGVDHEHVVCDYRRHSGQRSTSYAVCLRDNLAVLMAQEPYLVDDRLRRARDAGLRHYRRTFGAKLVLADLRDAVGVRSGVTAAALRALSFAAREPRAVGSLLRAQVGRRASR